MDRTLNRIAESLNLLLAKERECDSAKGQESTNRPSASLCLPGPQDSLTSYEQLSSTNLTPSLEDSWDAEGPQKSQSAWKWDCFSLK